MDLPVNAIVECTDTVGGYSTAVILDPATNQVSHIVVREPGLLGIEHLVAVELVVESSMHSIKLSCSLSELEAMPVFMLADYLPMLPGFAGYPAKDAIIEAYDIVDSDSVLIEHENIPAADATLHRWARIHATDGAIGQVDAFLFNPITRKISHLLLREGHVWGRRDISIPIAQIDHFDAETVYLTLTKREIAALPAILISNPKTLARRR